MKNIDGAPFPGLWKKIGPKHTADSQVGVIDGTGHVIKWSRRNFDTPEEAHQAARLIRKAVDLYREVIGEGVVVETDVCVGQKIDAGGSKTKVYVRQPYVDGWESRCLPEEIKGNPVLQRSWENVEQSFNRLFQSEIEERDLSEGVHFPVNLTVGDARRRVKLGEKINPFVESPNLLVEKESLQLRIVDWGAYEPWDDAMEPSRQRIIQLAKKQR